jgi:hypothetical protein
VLYILQRYSVHAVELQYCPRGRNGTSSPVTLHKIIPRMHAGKGPCNAINQSTLSKVERMLNRIIDDSTHTVGTL